jgi:hypothetical protein
LYRRTGLVVDLVIDETRCVAVYNLQTTPSWKDVAADLFLMNQAFSECLLILRYAAPMSQKSAHTLHNVLGALKVVCPQLKVYPVLCAAEIDHDVELSAVSKFLLRSESYSALHLLGEGGWKSRDWLVETESLHERILCSFPCISPITAQILLSQLTLTELFRKREADVMALVGACVPARVIQQLRRSSMSPTSRPYSNLKNGRPIQKHESKIGFKPRTGGSTQTMLEWTKKQ